MPTNHVLISALHCEPTPYTPIWVMRQAGRYLPEYRKTREKFPNFMDMCKNPDAACEVTLQPLARFDLDAAIIFSDILTIPDAMGLGLSFEKNEGPVFAKPLQNIDDIYALQKPDIHNQLHYVFDAITVTRRAIGGKVPLIGFAGSPWTMATYMVEGGSSKTFSVIKKLLYVDPKAMHHLLTILSDSVITYLQAQIDAGADVVKIFDTWGGVLSPREYNIFSLEYMSKITKALHLSHPKTPVILFTKGGAQWLTQIADSGCAAVAVDWTIDLSQAKKMLNGKVALQGNMDPCILYASADRVRQEVATILAQFGHGSGHVFNLGHGIYPDIPLDNVRVMVDAVHELSEQYHKETVDVTERG